MPATPAYRIFVSSPGDVGREREMARKVIARVEGRIGGRLRLEPYFWEEMPMLASRGDFQTQIHDPAEYDLLLCILWSRLGSRLHPGQHRRADGTEFASGTEYEFESAARAAEATGRPELLVYRRTETPLFPPEPRAEMEARLAQWEAMQEFCRRWFTDPETGTFRAAFNSYANLAEFEEKLEGHLLHLLRERLAAGAAGAEPSAGGGERARALPAWMQGSPYRGLQTFEAEHEPLFFGRTRARDEVLGALRARWLEERRPFVLVFGASGSGKSSLLRAGVLPWLVRPGVVEDAGLWRSAVWRPSDTPAGGDLLDGLAAALLAPGALPELGADGTDATELAGLLRQKPDASGLLLKGALSQAAAEMARAGGLPRQPVARLALGLDQLEEIFTVAERFGAEGRGAFFRVIASLVESGLAWVVATLRSDFFPRCEEHPELMRLKEGKGQYHLLAPSAAELSQMIRLPAEAAGAILEEDPERGRLEDTLRDEALAEPGALPLLEYALDELYRAGAARGVLTHADHARLGGVGGALARRAEETFAALPAAAQGALDGLLRQLVRLGEGEGDLPARRTAAHAAAVAPAGARELVEAFLAARLLVADQAAGGEGTLTVAHESLLRGWPRVVEWVRANRDFLRVRARLGTALARWEESGRDDDYLLPAGRPLAEAEDLLSRHADTLEETEQAFIRASSARRAADARRRRRILRAVAAALAVLAAIAGWQWREARHQATAAERNLEEVRRLLAESVRNDVQGARDYFQAGDDPRALVHLGRTLRYNAASPVFAMASIWLHTSRLQPPLAILLGHDGRVTSVMFSPDGRHVLTGSGDGTARLWDAASGAPAGEVMKHVDFEVSGAVLSPDGRRVLTGSADKTARVWDAATGRPIGEPLAQGSEVLACAWSPDSRRIVTAGNNALARLWDAETGRPLGEPMRHEGWVYGAVFSPDGRRVLTASLDKTARQWDAETGRPLGEPMRHEAEVWRAVYSPDGRRILTACWDRAGHLWDAATGASLAVPLRHGGEVRAVAWSPDGRRVVTAGLDKTARVWDPETGRALVDPMRHADVIRFACFSPDGRRVLTGSDDRTARQWDAETGEPAGEPMRHDGSVEHAAYSADGRRIVTASADGSARVWVALPRNPLAEPMRHAKGITAIAVSPDGRRVVTSSYDKTARLWEAATALPIGEPMLHEANVLSVAWSPDGRRVATAGEDGKVRQWDAETGRAVGPVIRQEAEAWGVAWSPDSRRLLTACFDKTARIWDADTGQPAGPVLTHPNEVLCVAWSADGRRIATGCADAQARRWDAVTGEAIGEPLRHIDLVTSVAWSPDGTRLLTGSYEKAARQWDAKTGQQIGPPMSHDDWVWSAVYSPDGRRVLTASSDKTARVWDAATGQPLGEPLRHESRVLRAAFGPDGRHVFTASLDRTARAWLLPPDDPGPTPAWFVAFLRWRAQARLDTNGAYRNETGAEQVATRQELIAALDAVPATDSSLAAQLVRRFLAERDDASPAPAAPSSPMPGK